MKSFFLQAKLYLQVCVLLGARLDARRKLVRLLEVREFLQQLLAFAVLFYKIALVLNQHYGDVLLVRVLFDDGLPLQRLIQRLAVLDVAHDHAPYFSESSNLARLSRRAC